MSKYYIRLYRGNWVIYRRIYPNWQWGGYLTYNYSWDMTGDFNKSKGGRFNSYRLAVKYLKETCPNIKKIKDRETNNYCFVDKS